jgi:hypothetical protein
MARKENIGRWIAVPALDWSECSRRPEAVLRYFTEGVREFGKQPAA